MATSLNSHTITISSSIPYKCFCVDGKFCDSSIKKKKRNFCVPFIFAIYMKQAWCILVRKYKFCAWGKTENLSKEPFYTKFQYYLDLTQNYREEGGNGYEYFKRFWENGPWFCVFFYDCCLWFRGVKTCLQYLQQT